MVFLVSNRRAFVCEISPTYLLVNVAMPDKYCSILRAVRSAVSIARALPVIVKILSPISASETGFHLEFIYNGWLEVSFNRLLISFFLINHTLEPTPVEITL